MTGFTLPGVVEFVAARASENLTKLQRTTRRLQQVQFKALAIIKISTAFNRLWNAVRDQGVGGSNPLSPTIDATN
jgi:hypothetical protein